MIVYLDGALVDAREARVSVFDRGFLFGDGVYEGLRVEGGRVLALGMHEERLLAGLGECRIGGFGAGMLGEVAGRVAGVNGVVDGFVYVQVTRGAPALGDGAVVRSRLGEGLAGPTVFAYAEAMAPMRAMEGVGTRRVALVRDTRWSRGHVKGVSLLGNVIGAYEAGEAGGEDAIFVAGGEGAGGGAGAIRGGVVSEGLATNVFVSVGGRVVTPSLASAPMLGGVTRRVLLEAMGDDVDERVVGVEELRGAEEVALVGTRTAVVRVGWLDGVEMGSVGMSERLLGVLKGALLGVA